MRQAIPFRWPLGAAGWVGAVGAPHHGGKSANPLMLYDWARPSVVVVSQRPSAPGTSDVLTPLERSGIPLLRTWQRGAVHFQWSSDAVIMEGFIDHHGETRSRPRRLGK